MAIDLHMCEPTDSTGHIGRTFFDLNSTTYEHACRYEDCKMNKKVLATPNTGSGNELVRRGMTYILEKNSREYLGTLASSLTLVDNKRLL